MQMALEKGPRHDQEHTPCFSSLLLRRTDPFSQAGSCLNMKMLIDSASIIQNIPRKFSDWLTWLKCSSVD